MPVLHCLKRGIAFVSSLIYFLYITLLRLPLPVTVALFQQDIALVFVGRFRCGLQRFFGEEKLFQ